VPMSMSKPRDSKAWYKNKVNRIFSVEKF
jgi:hypothetical protein